MSSYDSAKRILKGRQEDPSRKTEKGGNRWNSGIFSNPRCEKYINKVKVSEKLQYKETKDKNEKMSSVKKTSSNSNDSEKDVKKNRKIGEIKLDTGVIEVGYDEEKDKIIVSFVQEGDNQVSRQVNEASATSHQVYGAEKFQSNDRAFYGGAMSIKYNIEKPELAIKEQFKKISDDLGGKTTVDEVIPFNQTKQETSQIENLKDLKSNNSNDRSNIHSAISKTNELKNIKGQQSLSFNQKIDKAVKDVKFKSKDSDNKNDAYLLYLLRKRLEEEGLLPSDDDDNNNNNDINKDLENDKAKQIETENVVQEEEMEGTQKDQQSEDSDGIKDQNESLNDKAKEKVLKKKSKKGSRKDENS